MDSSKIGFRLSYLETGSFFHRLSGVSKLILFIYWIFLTLLSFDLRILVAMLIIVYCFLALSRVPFRVYRPFVLILLVFVLFNAGVIFLFAPDQGDIYIGSRTVLLELNGRYDITRETLVYLAVVVCKYITVLPMALLFIFSTHPTEFSASLASVG
ncbi:MAG: energy-coupling factor transporter transmembrane component T family protein, partial [Salinispira sp.]